MGISADPWQNPGHPCITLDPQLPSLRSSLHLLLQDSQKQGRENFLLQESVYHTYFWMLLHLFFQFPLDIDLKSVNPMASKALTLSPIERSSLSPLELVRFSFNYSSGKLQVTSLPEPCNPRHKSEPTEIENFFLKERK